MIYSRRHKLIFAHVSRTGGTSLTGLLQSSIPDAVFLDGRKHITLDQVRRLRGLLSREEFRACYRFMFVRNPWDRMVSMFLLAKSGQVPRLTSRLRMTPYTTFREFLDRDYWGVHKPQVTWLFGPRGEVLATQVFRFERYLDGIKAVCQRFHLDIRNLPHRMATPHAHYTTYYDRDTRRIVTKRFAQDSEYFGYTFEE